MVNLPPDQNERRNRDQILSFDELLAVVLALLGIGAIFFWGTSRNRDWLGEGNLLGNATQSLTGRAGERDLAVENDDVGTEPLALENFFGPNDQVEDPVVERREGGLPSLAEPRSEFRTAPGAVAVPQATALEPADLEPSNVVPEPLAETPSETATPLLLDISDVSEDYWAYPFIKDMYDQGLLPDFPSGQFEPDKELTRAELAALLNQAFVSDPVEREPLEFGDIPPGYWAADAIDQVVERGFMSGYPDNDFRPDELVPRYQVLVALASGLDLGAPSNPDQLLQGLGDLQGLPDWARGKVAAAAEQRLIVNHPEPGQLKPIETATRAEIVAMMHQSLVAEGRLDPIQSEYIVTPQ